MAELAEFLGCPAVVSSPEMRLVLDRVKRLAPLSSAVLITGEIGTGKEVVARALHHFSPRSNQAWVDVSCPALPLHRVESELFGQEDRAHPKFCPPEGLFELANRGTIFLHEVGELDAPMQTRLLLVLDGAAYCRPGGNRQISVDVRVVAATSQDLRAKVEEGSFRADLYYRLTQLQLPVPALRDRRSDIVPLARFFLDRQGISHVLTPEVEAALLAYHWPGNIRQLRDVVTNAAARCAGPELRLEHLPAVLRGSRHYDC